ncbi:hypothetical protein ACET65_19830 [Aeromonas rivipollensis]
MSGNVIKKGIPSDMFELYLNAAGGLSLVAMGDTENEEGHPMLLLHPAAARELAKWLEELADEAERPDPDD